MHSPKTLQVKRMFAGVSVKLLGHARTAWFEQSTNYINYKAQEIYIDRQIYFFGSCETLVYIVLDFFVRTHCSLYCKVC